MAAGALSSAAALAAMDDLALRLHGRDIPSITRSDADHPAIRAAMAGWSASLRVIEGMSRPCRRRARSSMAASAAAEAGRTRASLPPISAPVQAPGEGMMPLKTSVMVAPFPDPKLASG